MPQQTQGPLLHIFPRCVLQLHLGEMGLKTRQTQLVQISAQLLEDTLSSHHQTKGTSRHLYLLLILTRSGIPFQCLQPVPFCVFKISGRCPWYSAKVLIRCIDNHPRRLGLTYRTHHRQFWVFLSLCLFVSSNDSMMRQAVNPSNFARGGFTDFLHNHLFDLVSDHGIVF